jgi:Na+-transporting NADH:ubiquinone oxidoreductase subunit C
MHDTKYTLLFATAVCLVCSVFVATSAVVLKPRQDQNIVLDRQKKVLAVAGLMQEGQKLSAAQVSEIFAANIQAVVIDLATGERNETVDAATFDQRRASKDLARSRVAPSNAAKVQRLPNQAMVYQVVIDGQLQSTILPVEGKGLWSTLYGFIAIAPDTVTIKGITFYEHGETPGLGGEVDNPRWKAGWQGRKAFDERGKVRIQVKKGRAGSVEADPYNVDGLAGATLTSRGVSNLVQFWLGEQGFGPYLSAARTERGI